MAAEPCYQVEYLNSSRQGAPSNSVDLTDLDDVDDYHSYWATISRNTTEGGGQRQDEEMTENSEIFH